MSEYINVIKELTASNDSLSKLIEELQQKAEQLLQDNLKLFQFNEIFRYILRPEIRN